MVRIITTQTRIEMDRMCNRIWRNALGETFSNPKLGPDNLSVMTYNVLSDACVRKMPHIFSYTDQKYFEWSERWKMLLSEIKARNPDVMALREVDHYHLQDYFTPNINKIGYEIKYKRNTGDGQFGCLLAWKRDKLQLEDYQGVEYSGIDRGQYYGQNVGQIGVFSSRTTHVGKPLCIANTHIHFNMKRGDIKLAQIMHLLGKIDHVTEHSSIPVILCGDFNIYPHSLLYSFLRNGEVKLDSRRSLALSDPLYIVPSELTRIVNHSLSLKSVYNPSESRISCFTHKGGKTVDYIWYSPESSNWRLTPLCYLQLPKRYDIAQHGGIPSSTHPSDHFPLLGIFEWTDK